MPQHTPAHTKPRPTVASPSPPTTPAASFPPPPQRPSRSLPPFPKTTRLTHTTCSFAIVIQQLPNPLRDAICIFYLVLRGLDTVEDDMALSVAFKVPELRRFYKRIYDRCAHTCLCVRVHACAYV